MGVAHPAPADEGQLESRGEDGLPTEGPTDKGRPDRVVGGAEGAESLREEDGGILSDEWHVIALLLTELSYNIIYILSNDWPTHCKRG